MADDAVVACPRCGAVHDGAVGRTCPGCGMLLAPAGPGLEETGRLHERARKILPQYAEGELVTVATGRNQAEADFIGNLLLEEGVPSLVRRARGFDVPDMLAAGPRDVLVPRSGESVARQVLLQAEMHDGPGSGGPDPRRLALGLLTAVLVVALVVWLGSLLAG